ncbi:ABC transporter ATP-binding protein [Hymenobacter sp. BT770]|uniref:ABC transporter ATP-binding protein n=1 Tax=Hymenobacter sp. BT770 TaxID=2886942 RepID=UPI001D120112|nr:ABC transporter ATP-binding protein [Hymenobacter sp. BT770]MCC3152950.1 ABC transporter ATP-binding protein [Hymenobacter sp. BT770]MDO3415136.1 ABC transporter ATP-binding protein [Hymenobacter sp. BT770]
MALLAVSGIGLEEHGHRVLEQISFTQQPHQKIALAGESGTGKSTLLQIIAGLIQPNSGEVRVNGSRVRGPAETLVPGHPGVAYLAQNSALPHSLRVEQVLRYANKRPAAEAQALYELCRIDHLAQRRTDQLSGGEQQRVALARLLLGSPQLLLLDEPFSNLDRMHKRVLQGIIDELGSRLGITCLLVSHDAADTLSWADEILVMHRGRIIQQGLPQEIYQQPVNEYTAALFGGYNLLRGADRQALAPTPKRKALTTQLMVRPEQLRLGPATGGGLNGTVAAVRFFGGYYEVQVALSETTINVRTDTAAFSPGDMAQVSVMPGAGWNMALPN